MSTYGENFRRIRERQQASIAEVARALRLRHPGNISVLERGDHVPDPRTILKHARVLGCAPSELLKDVETEYDQIRRGDYDEATRQPPRDAAAELFRRRERAAPARRTKSS